MLALTEAQVAAFRDDGYILLERAIDPADLQPLICELEEVVDRKAREAYAEGRLPDLFAEEPFDRRLAKIGRALGDPDPFLAAFEGKSHKTDGLFSIMTYPALLDIVEALIGPEILSHPQFNLRA